jgi:GNAT superfamily N-acetyltransferase
VVEIVPACADDVRAVARRRKLDDLSTRLALESAERGSAWAARDHGEIVGVVVAHDSDEERYIGDCFVELSYRDQGVGTALLQAAFETGELTRTALVAPGDAAALSLGLRFAMAPRETVLRFAGAIPREEELAKMAAGDYRFAVETIDAAAHRFALDELDHHTRGTTRPADHASFAVAASGHAFFLSGECVGYAYVWPDGRVGPLACASEAYLVQILAYALVTLTRAYSASWCTLLVPGSNRRIARASLRAGLRIEETFVFACDAFVADLSTYAGYHRLLF